MKGERDLQGANENNVGPDRVETALRWGRDGLQHSEKNILGQR